MAVWRQNLPVIRLLLDESCDASAKDTMGFMPLDYAEAIGNEEVIELVREATKVDRVSYTNVWNRLLEKPVVDPQQAVFSYEDENGSIVDGNSAQFAAMTQGAEFSPAFYFSTRGVLLKSIEKSLDYSYSRITKIDCDPEILDRLLTEEPPLHLKRRPGAGYGVVATKPLEAFKPVVIYAGEGVLKGNHEKSALSSAYYFPPFEAHKIRNLGAMVNDGFPNCSLTFIDHPSGISYPAILPLREIKADEELFVHYGDNHDVKIIQRREFNGGEARAFLKEKSLAAWAGELLLLIQRRRGGVRALTQPEAQKLVTIQAKLSYLLQTPSLLFPLIFENRITQEDLKSVASNPYFVDVICTKSQQEETLQKLAKAIGTIDAAQMKFQGDVKKELLPIFIQLSLKHQADAMNAAFAYFIHCLNESLHTPVPPPAGILKNLYWPTFNRAIVFFETTRSCFLRREDASDEELALLNQISLIDPVIENIYAMYYKQVVTDDYPKLKQFILAKHQEIADRRAKGEGPWQDLSRYMNAMAPNGLPPEIESKIASLQANPAAQKELIQMIMSKFK
ncbi:MAG: SET domain-containing protein-lysine N-methyltransferase [Parachlamydiaceae bacterium]